MHARWQKSSVSRNLIKAMLCGLVSYMMMNFMMTSAPLAMQLCGIAPVYSEDWIEMRIRSRCTRRVSSRVT